MTLTREKELELLIAALKVKAEELEGDLAVTNGEIIDYEEELEELKNKPVGVLIEEVAIDGEDEG